MLSDLTLYFRHSARPLWGRATLPRVDALCRERKKPYRRSFLKALEVPCLQAGKRGCFLCGASPPLTLSLT